MALGLSAGRLRVANGVPSAGGINTASPDTIKAMAPEMTFDYFAVRLNGEKAAGKKLSLNIEFTDLNQPYRWSSRMACSITSKAVCRR